MLVERHSGCSRDNHYRIVRMSGKCRQNSRNGQKARLVNEGIEFQGGSHKFRCNVRGNRGSGRGQSHVNATSSIIWFKLHKGRWSTNTTKEDRTLSEGHAEGWLDREGFTPVRHTIGGP